MRDRYGVMVACALTAEVVESSDDTGGVGHLQAETGLPLGFKESPARWAGPSALCAVLANLQHQLPVGPADEQEQDFIAPGNLLHFLQIAHPDPVDRDDDVAASQPALPGRASGLDIRDFHAAAAGCRLRRKLCAFEAWMDILAAALCHRPLAKDSRDRQGIAIPKQLDPDGVAGALQADRVSQLPAVVDLLVVDP